MLKHIETKEALNFFKSYYFVELRNFWYFWGGCSFIIISSDRFINSGEILYSIIGISILTVMLFFWLLVDFGKRLKKVSDDRGKYVARGERIPKWLELKSCNPWSK